MAKPTIGPLVRLIVYAHDLPKLIAFYEDVLQLSVLKDLRSDGWIAFDIGGIELALHSDAPAERAGWFPKLVFHTPDVEAMYAHLNLNGVLINDVYESDEGRAFGASDPEGNDFRFVETSAGHNQRSESGNGTGSLFLAFLGRPLERNVDIWPSALVCRFTHRSEPYSRPRLTHGHRGVTFGRVDRARPMTRLVHRLFGEQRRRRMVIIRRFDTQIGELDDQGNHWRKNRSQLAWKILSMSSLP